MKWWHWLPFVPLLLTLVACEPALSFPPAGATGPASLQLVPADFYSRGLRPGPSTGRTSPAKTDPAASEAPEPEAARVPIVEIPDDLDERLRGIQDRVRKLRDRLNKSRPLEPPT